MTLPKIEERTLYPPIINYLQNIGFEAHGETKIIKKHPDIVFKADSISFVIEVKLGKPEVGLKAVAQASDYARRLGTSNIIVLIYPEKFRNQAIFDESLIERIAISEKVHALVMTDYWTESLILEPKELFRLLYRHFLVKKIKVDFKTTVQLIENYVSDLNSVVFQIKEEELISEVVDKLDLFSAIGEIKDKKLAKKQVINLASYLLFNQLLFYHIYKRKTSDKKLLDLDEINKTEDIQGYFDAITDIDYQSIYRVNILGHIPNKRVVIDTLNEVIKAIRLLRAEHITHDLAGRFFHDLIPFEVRKVLAAFYTHPIAGEILAGLTIDSSEENIIDPACGSGTLLVSSYIRKQELYQKLYGFKDTKKMHKIFIENEITGMDIMPFAAHISAINLTMQNIEQQTNTVRIATLDSLEMADLLKSPAFKKKGIEFSPYTTSIQTSLQEIFERPIKIKKKGTVSPEGKGFSFKIKPFDNVIMNPPFSDREKMPKDMREKLKKNKLGNICGHQVNLWGYFLVLADLLLKPGKKIGAVIPINIARGKATEKIRNFLLDKYYIKYIIKPVGDTAFSEGAAFRDVLLIAEKRKTKKDDITGLIFIKKSIRQMNEEEARKILKEIEKIEPIENQVFSNESFDIWFIKTDFFKKKNENLMYFLRGQKPETRKTIIDFFEKVEQNGTDKLRNLAFEEMSEGFHASPKGLSELVFITNPIDKSRTSRNVIMTLEEIKDNKLKVKINPTNQTFKISTNLIKPALKTITSIPSIDISKNHDYIITDEFNDFDKVKILSKWEGSFSWDSIRKKLRERDTYFAIQHRIRMNSPNTSCVGVYNDIPFYTTHACNIFKTEKEESKILALFLNSILGLLQLSTLSKETTEGYMEFMQADLISVKVFDIKKITEKEKKILFKLFEELRDVVFPSIIEQLKDRFSKRLELDKTILKIIGFSDSEINEWLPKIYDSLIEELNTM